MLKTFVNEASLLKQIPPSVISFIIKCSYDPVLLHVGALTSCLVCVLPSCGHQMSSIVISIWHSLTYLVYQGNLFLDQQYHFLELIQSGWICLSLVSYANLFSLL